MNVYILLFHEKNDHLHSKLFLLPNFFFHNNDPFSSCRLKSHFEENPRDLGMIHEPYANSCVSKVTCLTSLYCFLFLFRFAQAR